MKDNVEGIFPKRQAGHRGRGSLLEDSTGQDRYLLLRKDVRVISGRV